MFRKFCISVVKLFMKCRFKVNVVNQERFLKMKTGCILACNHVSAWETVLMPVFSKKVIHMMAKEELFEKKFNGWFLRQMAAFPIARKKADISAIKSCVKLLKEGKSICMFPEGTRSKDGKMNFKTGVSLISHTAKVPVIPVGIVPEDNFKFRSKVHIVFGEPIYFTDCYDRKVSKEELAQMTDKIKYEVIKAIESAKNKEQK